MKTYFNRQIEILRLELSKGNFMTCYQESIAAIMEQFLSKRLGYQ